MKYKKIIISALLGIGLLLGTVPVKAAEEVPAGGFDAEAVLPENQIDKSVGYFHVAVSPNEEMNLHVKITNPTDKAVTIEPSVNRGQTNSAGVIEYSQKAGKIEAGSEVNIEDVATIEEQEIKVEPGTAYDLQIHVKMPDKESEGIQLGAIYLLQQEETSNEGNIHNQFAREIGIVLESGNPDQIPSNLTMTDAKAGQMNARNNVLLTIENDQPKLMSLEKIHVTIKKQGSDKPIWESENEHISVSPNTVFTYPVSLEGEEYEAGTYAATFEAKEGDTPWSLTKEFKITKEVSEELNESDVIIQGQPSFFDLYKVQIIAGVVLVVVIVGFCLYIRRLKKQGYTKNAQ